MIISMDTETHMIQQGLLAPPLVCSSWADVATASGAYIFDPEETVIHLKAVIRDGLDIVGCNVAYDFAVMLAHDYSLAPLIFEAYAEGRIHDVSIRQALNAIYHGHLYMDPSGGPLRDNNGKVVNRYSLATCLRLTTGRLLEKTDTFRTRYAELDGIPISEWPKEAIEYSKGDAIATLEVYNAQEDYKNLQDEAAQCRAAFALHLSSVRGLRTDPIRVAGISERVQTQFALDLQRFQASGFVRVDGTLDKRALSEFVTKAYLGNPPMTAGGAKRGPVVSTSRDTLEESGDDLLEAYAASGVNRTLHNTFVPILEAGTQVGINSSYTTLVATGRTSCARPNWQNLPRHGGIRECVVARPGFVFGFADYSALELSTLAQVCYTLLGASQMREAINSGRDLHSALAADLTGKTYEQVKEAVKKGEKWAEDARYAAKAANFGFPGGMGAAKFVIAKRKEGLKLCLSMGKSDRCGVAKIAEYKGRPCSPVCAICVEAAEDLRKAWFRAWPEMEEYFLMVSRETENGSGSIEQLVSRRSRGNCGFTDGANTRFQGLAADGAKHALFLLTRECYEMRVSVLFGSRPVLFIHDEIGSEFREPCASPALERVIEIMIAGMEEFTPDVKIRAEGYLCRHWFKGGKDLKVDGKSVPVKPDENGKWIHDTGENNVVKAA